MYQWPPGEPKEGQRVWLGLKSLLNSTGTLRFVGKIADQQGDYAGVELDEPKGKNDGEEHAISHALRIMAFSSSWAQSPQKPLR